MCRRGARVNEKGRASAVFDHGTHHLHRPARLLIALALGAGLVQWSLEVQIRAMQLTKQTNYALRMLMYCAAREEAVRLGDVRGSMGCPKPSCIRCSSLRATAASL